MKIKQLYQSAKVKVLADQVVVSGSSFLSNILVARSLGITDYGVFSALLLIQLFLLSLQQSTSSGIYQVLFGRLDASIQKKYNSGLFYTQIIIYSILVLIAFGFSRIVTSELKIDITVFLPAAVSIILYLLQDFLRKILITREQESKALWIDVITNVLQLSLFGIFAFTGHLNLSIVFWVIGLTFIPSVIAGIIWLKPGVPKISSIAFALKTHQQHSGWMFLSALLQWFAGNFFVVAAGWWLGLAALGALRLAQYIFGLLNVMIQAIENYALPKGSTLQSSGQDFKKFLVRIFIKTSAAVIPLLILLSVFAKQLLLFSGNAAYTSYGYVMYGLSLIYVLIICALPVRITLRVQLLNKNYFIGYLWATAFSLIFSKLIIQQWQLAGVLAGLFCTQFIVVVYWLFILNKRNIFKWKLSTSF